MDFQLTMCTAAREPTTVRRQQDVETTPCELSCGQDGRANRPDTKEHLHHAWGQATDNQEDLSHQARGDDTALRVVHRCSFHRPSLAIRTKGFGTDVLIGACVEQGVLEARDVGYNARDVVRLVVAARGQDAKDPETVVCESTAVVSYLADRAA